MCVVGLAGVPSPASGRSEREGAEALGLVRTILALIILLILVHVGLAYANIGAATNTATDAVYSLGRLLESPAQLILGALSLSGRLGRLLNPNSLYSVALTAAALYFVLYLLLGVGKR